MTTTHTYSKGEEIANAITHGIGIIFSISALTLLIVFAALEGSVASIISYTVYGVTMLLLYVSSTLLHAFPEGKVKNLFEIFDHSSIYLFIAGSYTPILINVIGGKLGVYLLAILWSIAAIGILFKIFFVKRFLYASTMLYIVMGWLIVFAWQPLVTNFDDVGLILLIIGGLLYTIGALFYMFRWFPFHHMVWHLFVLAGTIVHFFAILIFA
ncbi:PAQR family membrane homeostasis protein TrhA [Anaerobacillus isosaccharinicus]|uniref:Hemolysin D n=1 Tax=Anaerobacillus isosaccharinicus TaxID=1532552 RepID=A0A1S2LAK1_9BACI|nr:hemolysin III family protein [Anaerobacillus isosaccharinicus]MBA5588128.1 hemolysin III family protein [Anaerobacillus isosaccharinicus]QOY38416.1 hemolysin III family protein [Anaerobacillus isosaccharinicus]